jgi:pilus assembly protein CpaF
MSSIFLKVNQTTFPLKQGRNTLGRISGNDIVVPHAKISSKHLTVTVSGKKIILEDLGSTNGTYVNGKTIKKENISIGLVFQIADLSAEVLEDNRTVKIQDLTMEDFKRKLHAALLERMDLKRVDISKLADEELKEKAKGKIEEILNELAGEIPAAIDRAILIKDVLEDSLGLGPLEDFLKDSTVTEIMVNHSAQIYLERNGKIVLSEKKFSSDQQIMDVIGRIVAPLGRRIDESSPMVDARLSDGSRVNAIIPPLALKGPCLTIRKFFKRKLTPADLITFGSLTTPMLSFLQIAVKYRKNIVISGGTGSGKTTLLNILSSYIPDDERIITLEDSAELQLPQAHVISLESRPPNIEGTGAISIRDLVRNCLRMRPDRIVVGECRGGEALDMLQAMNTGHDGSLTTVHANTPRDAISRLETLCLMSGTELPLRAIRDQVSSAVDMIVQQCRLADGSRKVTHITEITGIEGESIKTQDIFVFKQKGFDASGKALGQFTATGNIPVFAEELIERGIPVDRSMFQH